MEEGVEFEEEVIEFVEEEVEFVEESIEFVEEKVELGEQLAVVWCSMVNDVGLDCQWKWME